MRTITFSLSLALLTAPILQPAPLNSGRPESVGISAERLQRVNALVQRHLAQGNIAGAITAVVRRGTIVHFDTHGVMDLEKKTPMRKDAIFRLASMTKPLTSIAVMMLHEEGRFLLTDPVAKFLPEFRMTPVAVPHQPHQRGGEGYTLMPAERPITIQHLLSHTAGLASGTSGPTMQLAAKLAADRKASDTLADYIARLAELPLNFQPGTAWEYGPATDVLGRLVEVVSGQSLDEFFRTRILNPLGMKDTHFYLPAAKMDRLASAYKQGTDSKLEKLQPSRHEDPNGKFYSGGGGLAGTAEDYLRFAQMLLNGGELDGKRIVGRKTIDLMTANHIGDMPLWDDSLRGHRFGLGFRVVTDMGRSGLLATPGSYGWGGAYGTYFWVDPKEEMVGLLLFQLMPYAHLNLRYEFHNTVMQALVD